MPQHKNPCHGGHKIYNFGKFFLGHQCYTLSLFDLSLGVEKTTFYENVHSTWCVYMTYMTTLHHKNPSPCVMKFTNLVGPKEKDLNNVFLLYDLYGRALVQKPLPDGSWNLQFGYILPWCLNLAPE